MKSEGLALALISLGVSIIASVISSSLFLGSWKYSGMVIFTIILCLVGLGCICLGGLCVPDEEGEDDDAGG